MRTQNIIQELKSRPRAVYLVCGDGALLKDEFFKEVKSLLSKSPEFNYDVFHCGLNTADQIIAQLISYPMGEDFRVVVAKDAGKLQQAERKKILAYIENPSESSLFFLETEQVPPGAFFKTVAEKGEKLLFSVRSERELGRWLELRAGKLGKRLSREAAEELQEVCGKNLHMLANELEKLSLQAGDNREISAEEIGFSPGRSRIRTGFELGGAIGEGDRKLALCVLADLFSGGGVPAEMVLGALAWQFRALWKVSLAVREGVRGGKLAARCGVPPFRVGEFTRQALKFSDPQFEQIFREILRTDVNIKTRENPRFELELMIVRLCRIVAD